MSFIRKQLESSEKVGEALGGKMSVFLRDFHPDLHKIKEKARETLQAKLNENGLAGNSIGFHRYEQLRALGDFMNLKTMGFSWDFTETVMTPRPCIGSIRIEE
jgi:hypothetical protein